ncbi:MAG TPA: hypothetical protein VND97_05535 [Beijerinckiaceae bacterium]|nr:hypothetical protein [Beijerinckiaceae bacterium]
MAIVFTSRGISGEAASGSAETLATALGAGLTGEGGAAATGIAVGAEARALWAERRIFGGPAEVLRASPPTGDGAPLWEPTAIRVTATAENAIAKTADTTRRGKARERLPRRPPLGKLTWEAMVMSLVLLSN